MSEHTVLIVDDEKDTLAILEKELAEGGYAIMTAGSAISLQAALIMEGPELPDLIILDIGLPDLDGRSIAAKLRENTKLKDIPILFLTAQFSKVDELRMGHKLDGHVVLTKPYDLQELHTVIQALIGDHQKIILMVETEEATVPGLRPQLLEAGYSLLTTRHANEMLSLARSQQPDLSAWMCPLVETA